MGDDGSEPAPDEGDATLEADLAALHRLAELERPPTPPAGLGQRPVQPDRQRGRALSTLGADPSPGAARSRFDPLTEVVLYRERQPDFLLVKDDEPSLLDCLATLMAKEYVVYNNPRARSDDLAEEMVRMQIRVRRHLPRRH